MTSHKLVCDVQAEIFNAEGKLREKRFYSSEPLVENYFFVNIKDKFGKLLRSKKYLFRSFHPNFSRWLNYAFLEVVNNTAGAAGDQIAQLGGGALTTSTHNTVVDAPVTNDNYGIQVGTGSTQPAFTDTQLNSKVSHGTASGNLYYNATTVTPVPVTTNGSDYNKLIITRLFENQHATDAVDIKELGIAALDTSATEYFLIARDTKAIAAEATEAASGPSNIIETVEAGEILEVKYELSIGYSSTGGFTSNMISFLTSELKDDTVTAKSYAGATASVDFTAAQTDKALLNVTGADDNYGILIGSSSNTFDIDDYKMSNKILDASVDYGTMSVVDLTTNVEGTNPVEYYTLFGATRSFTSMETDSSVTIRESGLVLRKGAGPYTYYTIARVLLADTPAVDPIVDPTAPTSEAAVRGSNGIVLEPSEILRLTYAVKTVMYTEE